MAKTSKRRAKRGRAGAARSKARAGSKARGSPLQEFCRGLPGTTEDIKWEHDLVFSVGKKMYAGFDVDDADQFGFKCDDIEFERLTKVDGIIPAPYAARFGWVSVRRRGVLPLETLKKLIRRSYDLVVEGLPRKVREGVKG